MHENEKIELEGPLDPSGECVNICMHAPSRAWSKGTDARSDITGIKFKSE